MRKKRWLIVLLPVALLVFAGGLLQRKAAGIRPIPPQAAAPAVPAQARNVYALDLCYEPQAHTLSGQCTMTLVNPSAQAWTSLCLADWASADVFAQAPFGAQTGITQARLSREGEETPVDPVRDAQNPCKWLLPLDRPLAPGAALTLSFALTLHVPENDAPFGVRGDVCRLGGFVPQLALWDGSDWVVHPYTDYADCAASVCADFRLTLRAPRELTVICTGESETRDGVTQAHAENVRDFAVVLGKGFRQLTRQYGDTRVCCYYKGASLMGYEALAAACDALGAFGAAIGRYPYATLDVVSADISAGGMEYPQLVMIRQRDFALSTALLHGYTHDFFRETVAHEVAHQWFYGVLGNDQYAQPWLDEAFAEYLETVYADFVGIHHPVMHVDMTVPLDSSLDVLPNQYAVQSTVYWGGSAFLSELRATLGETAFTGALQSLYQAYGYDLLDTAAVLAAFRDAADAQQRAAVDALIERYFFRPAADAGVDPVRR